MAKQINYHLSCYISWFVMAKRLSEWKMKEKNKNMWIEEESKAWVNYHSSRHISWFIMEKRLKRLSQWKTEKKIKYVIEEESKARVNWHSSRIYLWRSDCLNEKCEMIERFCSENQIYKGLFLFDQKKKNTNYKLIYYSSITLQLLFNFFLFFIQFN